MIYKFHINIALNIKILIGLSTLMIKVVLQIKKCFISRFNEMVEINLTNNLTLANH